MVGRESQERAEKFVREEFPKVLARKMAEAASTSHKHVFPNIGGGHCAFCGAAQK